MKNSFTINKWIRAKRTKVFEAWTNPDLMQKWDCPEHCDLVASEGEVVTGGSYRTTMFDRESKEEVTVFGKYLEVLPGFRLKFTSQWENSKAPETIVTVDFADQDDGTMLTLTQEGFATEGATQGHEEGWASCLNKLAKIAPDLLLGSEEAVLAR